MLFRSTHKFKKSLDKLVSQGFDRAILETAIKWIANGKLPPCARYRDHMLTGNLLGVWDLHLKNDIVLLYEVDGDTLLLHNIGSHNQVFGK